MREIKFRGFRTVQKDWIYGNLIIAENGTKYIVENNLFREDGHHLVYTIYAQTDEPVFINQDTIGQYTGMNDSTGKEIYEGDIVVVGQDTGNKYDRYIMTFNDDSHSYLAKQQGTLGSYIGPGYWNDKLMVIGNCWDNPELLGGVHDEQDGAER
jgi:uncharacterized phage protein (TIGR01671 family)